MDNLQKLKQAFSEGLSIPVEQVNEELSYQSIAEWDSVSHLFLVEQIEASFGIQLETTDILEMTSFNDVKQVLTKFNISVTD